MPQSKKAHCPAPGAVVAAWRNYWAANQPQSPAQAGAVLIAEGIALLSEASQDAPKLLETCRRKYPRLDDAISTHIPAPVRERARHLKRERAFASLQELYLEAILGSLIKRGFMSRSLEPTTGPQRGASVSRPAVAASRVESPAIPSAERHSAGSADASLSLAS
jgi:hypothetical protein